MDNMSRDFAELFFTNISVNKISNACNSKKQDASKCKSKEMTTDYCKTRCVRFICQQLYCLLSSELCLLAPEKEVFTLAYYKNHP